MIRPPNEGIEVWLCVESVDFRRFSNDLTRERRLTLIRETCARGYALPETSGIG